MRFSVLLPTRNRLDLLRYAVETVRRQDDDGWEIVVSDNCSEDDVEGYVRSLGDARIRYYRTERFVPVTENWNNALERSTGDYVVMLGDDDGLMKGYFSTLRRVLAHHPDPDFVYTGALLFAYPGVMPDRPEGFLRTHGAARFLSGSTEPSWLDLSVAREMVRRSMRFQLRFDYNMQFAVISRRLIDSMRSRGPFFQSPYPDYYSMNAMMLVADRILVVPRPLVAIGVSPKSFGWYWANDKEQSGTEFLKNVPDADVLARVKDKVLPGPNLNTSWLLSMETLLQRYGGDHALAVDYGRYRLMQAIHTVRRAILSDDPAERGVGELVSRLTWREKLSYGLLLGPYARIAARLPAPFRTRAARYPVTALRTYPPHTTQPIPGRFANMLEVFERFDPGVLAAGPVRGAAAARTGDSPN